MYKVRNSGSPNKLRDVHIAIAYHNTGRTLQNVGDEYGVSPERVRQIHGRSVRWVNACNGMLFHVESYKHGSHKDGIAIYLKEYKDFLIEHGYKDKCR
jgi:Sigma-70, region 4